MWQRFLRLLITGQNINSFYSNPVAFVSTLFCVLLIPYLAYIFWGSLILIALVILGIYFIYLAIKTGKNRYHHY